MATLGMIGLGRMGGNMAERLRRGGHTVVGYDRSADSGRQVDSLEALVDALVESRASAVDAVLAAGEITEAEAEQYRAALEEAFTFRVTWDGQEATPTFTGLAA